MIKKYKKALFIVINALNSKNDLKSILYDFDIECLLFIISVMYIGRDNLCSEIISNNKEDLIKSKMKEFNKTFSSNKDYVISQMLQKKQLLDYLNSGIRFLSIS